MSGPFEGWEVYPQNLSSAICNPCAFDLKSYNQLLHFESQRMFLSNNELRLRVIELGSREYICRTINELEAGLEASREFAGIRVVLILQQYSLGSLMISEEAIRKLCTRFNIFPPFLDTLCKFGQRHAGTSDSTGSYHGLLTEDQNFFESSYLLKHAQEHGRDGPCDPWSLRQMGIYHKASIHTSENTFIVLNPSKQFQGRFNECAASATATSLTPHDVQIMLLSSVTNTWMRYTGHLEQQFNMIKTKANLSAGSQGHGSSEKANSEIQISDAQDIQVLREKLYQLNQVLGMNCDVFRGMKDSFNLKSVGRVSGRRQGNQFISSALSDTRSERQRVNNTLQKLCGTSELVRNILDVCALKALEANSRTTTDISIRAESGNQYMLDLTEKARKDARTLKTITILTLIYLPASFVATFLGTGYISLHVDRQRISMQFAHEMWIFGILTITFLSLTIGIWKWREHRNIKEDLEAVPRTA